MFGGPLNVRRRHGFHLFLNRVEQRIIAMEDLIAAKQIRPARDGLELAVVIGEKLVLGLAQLLVRNWSAAQLLDLLE